MPRQTQEVVVATCHGAKTQIHKNETKKKGSLTAKISNKYKECETKFAPLMSLLGLQILRDEACQLEY